MLHLIHTLPFSKLVIIGARLKSNGLIFPGDIPPNFQLVIFLLLLSDVSELSVGGGTK